MRPFTRFGIAARSCFARNTLNANASFRRYDLDAGSGSPVKTLWQAN
jgi:hypothetical protein